MYIYIYNTHIEIIEIHILVRCSTTNLPIPAGVTASPPPGLNERRHVGTLNQGRGYE